MSVELRAERLRLFITAIGEEPSMRLHEGGFLPGGWHNYVDSDHPAADYPEEFNLAWTCAELAQDLRDRQWTALEQFGAAYAAGEGATAEQRIATMPADDARRALLAAFQLGWQHQLPEG